MASSVTCLYHLICRKHVHVEDNITWYLTQNHLPNASTAEILSDKFLDPTNQGKCTHLPCPTALTASTCPSNLF